VSGRLVGRTFPVVFAAPSGAGKTSIAQALRARRDDVTFSISATTRAPRASERHGVDYYFHTEPEFQQMIVDGALLEWAQVHGHFYGTPRRNLDDAAKRGHFLILDIDVQGSRQVRRRVPEAISIFVLPPSGRELASRLAGRGSETQEVRAKRLRAAREEIKAVSEFDYVIVNEDVQGAVDDVEQILKSELLRVRRIPGMDEIVLRLCSGVDEYLLGGASATDPFLTDKE
jgi:guanylate kinase